MTDSEDNQVSEEEVEISAEEEEKWINQWLDDNYVPCKGVQLLWRLIYQHYVHHCFRNSQQHLKENEVQDILLKKYPHIEILRLGRQGQRSILIQGLDIQDESEEYETVVKGRKEEVEDNQDVGESSKVKVADNDTTAGSSKTASQLWIKQDKETKEAHRKMLFEWLDECYEKFPMMCLLRSSVYEHYLQFCNQKEALPAPQAEFGRQLQKKFPLLSMRRLGPRGQSRYYYMGIDIQSSCPAYKKMSQDRIFCPMGKPKTNHTYNVISKRQKTK